jgi:hypothetical protein
MFNCPVSSHVLSVQGLERTELALNYVSRLGEAVVVLAQMQLKVEIVLDFGYCLGAGIHRTCVEVLTRGGGRHLSIFESW